jgi:hypothetical protein
MPFDRNKSLQQLEGEDWGEPTYDSHLVTGCHRLHRVPLVFAHIFADIAGFHYSEPDSALQPTAASVACGSLIASLVAGG